ncbi:MAG: hypothetical protein Q4D87_09435 [Actinomycetaceae bacterium]|nr:hypothetical protein [Actinomycetaceae bacterium]
MQLREGTSVFIRSNGDVQVGLGRKSAIVSGLSPAEQSYLQTLRFPATGSDAVQRARKRGIPQERVVRIENLLDKQKLIQWEPEPEASPDTQRLLRRDGDTFALDARPNARVDIVAFGCGDPVQLLKMRPYVAALVESLKASAITRISFDYQGRDMGSMTRTALSELVGLEKPLTSDPHFVIALFARASSAAMAYPWQEAGIPHASVVFHEDCIQVGPFVRPGKSPCLKCVDRNFRDIDPDWPALQIQCRDQPFPVYSPDLTNTAAAMTARLVVNEFDGHGTEPGEVRFIDEDFVCERATWPRHLDCGCTNRPDAPNPAKVRTDAPDHDPKLLAAAEEKLAALEANMGRTRECVGV